LIRKLIRRLPEHLRRLFMGVVRKVVGRLDQGRKQWPASGINFRNGGVALIIDGQPVNIQSHRAVKPFDSRKFSRETSSPARVKVLVASVMQPKAV
jgi:hypothetical protein